MQLLISRSLNSIPSESDVLRCNEKNKLTLPLFPTLMRIFSTKPASRVSSHSLRRLCSRMLFTELQSVKDCTTSLCQRARGACCSEAKHFSALSLWMKTWWSRWALATIMWAEMLSTCVGLNACCSSCSAAVELEAPRNSEHVPLSFVMILPCTLKRHLNTPNPLCRLCTKGSTPLL